MAGAEAFDFNAYERALEPPRFVVGARTYVGVVPSAHALAPYEETFARADRGELTDAEADRLLDALARELFPPDPAVPPASLGRRVLRRLRLVREPPVLTPSEVFRAQRLDAQFEAIAHFCASRTTRAPAPGSSATTGAAHSAG
jgi:hypothetical protein